MPRTSLKGLATGALLLVGSLLIAQARTQLPAAPAPDEARTQKPARTYASEQAEPRLKRQHAYHNEAPTGPLPATLDPEPFADNRTAFVVYSLAARIRSVLYQQPCFCPCDEVEGHESLLDCFVGRHGLVCPVCKREAIFVFEESKKGKSPEAIREEVLNREWSKVDIEQYANAHSCEYRSKPK